MCAQRYQSPRPCLRKLAPTRFSPPRLKRNRGSAATLGRADINLKAGFRPMRLRRDHLPHLLLRREPVVEGMLADKPALFSDEVGCLGNHAVPLRLLRRVKRTWGFSGCRIRRERHHFTPVICHPFSFAIRNWSKLKLWGTESIASVDLSRCHSTLKPRDSLCTGAVSKAVRDDGTACLSLEGIVADSGGGIKSRFDISRIKTPTALLLRTHSPNPREAIRLQF